jgi:prepilin-type N-terminal cleavage/methylation domain-containing protein
MDRLTPEQGSCFSGRRAVRLQEGFTLLEVIITLAVIAIAAGILLPRLPDITSSGLEKEAGRIERMVRLVRTRAVSLRRYYQLNFDLENGTVRAEYFGPEGLFIPDDELHVLAVSDPILLADVTTSEQGRLSQGSARLGFSPRGYVEPSVIHLTDERDRSLSIIPALLSGNVEVVSGYRELAGQ